MWQSTKNLKMELLKVPQPQKKKKVSFGNPQHYLCNHDLLPIFQKKKKRLAVFSSFSHMRAQTPFILLSSFTFPFFRLRAKSAEKKKKEKEGRLVCKCF